MSIESLECGECFIEFEVDVISEKEQPAKCPECGARYTVNYQLDGWGNLAVPVEMHLKTN